MEKSSKSSIQSNMLTIILLVLAFCVTVFFTGGLTIFQKVSFGGYFLIALQLAFLSILLMLSNKVLPYHLTALGTTWENLSPGMQTMQLVFLKTGAVGMLSTSISMFILLFIPFKSGQVWANWAILVIALTQMLVVSFFGLYLRKKTQADTPVWLYFVLSAIAVVCSVLYLF